MPLDLSERSVDPQRVNQDALHALLPEVYNRIPRVSLGAWPTPIESLNLSGTQAPHFVKREDLSASDYGGNKVRCLETIFGASKESQLEQVWATGAYGSNQALAMATHASRADLKVGALLFPQPPSLTAKENLRALATHECDIRLAPSLLHYPFALAALWRRTRSRPERIIPPGAAVPLGALGHVAAALEVAIDVECRVLLRPEHVVLPVGSTCTAAGLVLGFALARHLGLGGFDAGPTIHAVRISPWPVTARFRILGLALRTASLLHTLGGPDLRDSIKASAHLVCAGGFMGGGYGRATKAGLEAQKVFDEQGAPALDTTYSAKAAAHLLRDLEVQGPVLFWSTKSSAPLPLPTKDELLSLPRRGQVWLVKPGFTGAE